jgi:hypothetical protein
MNLGGLFEDRPAEAPEQPEPREAQDSVIDDLTSFVTLA